jgi:phosphatidylserine/phosphatidylglycerophosphate/cardiolipin synthase-like enzyme
MKGVSYQYRLKVICFLYFLNFTSIAQVTSVKINPHIKIAQTKIFDNNAASFSEKYHLISKATQSIDMVYFIIEDDYSTSLFFQNVLEKMNAAKQEKKTIRVRILVDYFMSEKQLPLLRLLEKLGIEIKRYAGPQAEWVEDLQRVKINSQKFLSGLMAQDTKLLKASLPDDIKEEFSKENLSNLTPQEKLSLALKTLQKIGPTGPRSYLGLKNFLFRTHHKLLLIDGNCFMTGGRNLSDEYHSSRGDILIDGNPNLGIPARHYPFQDIDVSSCLYGKTKYEESPLTQSFERLWNHSLNVGLNSEFTAAELDTSNITKIEELHRKAKLANHLLKSTHSSIILEQEGGLNAQYVENVMTPHTILNSGITDLYTNLFNSLEEGDEASFVNAYFYLDPNLMTGHTEKDSKMLLLHGSLLAAAQRKASLTIYTNSIATTDLSIVNVMSYPYYKKFVSENIQIKELYKGPDLDQGSLHKKAAYFSRPKKGDVLLVGSYNLDARSHYKDTNVVLSIEVPEQLKKQVFEAYKRFTIGSIKWNDVNEVRLREIEETVIKNPKTKKLRKSLYVFRDEI